MGSYIKEFVDAAEELKARILARPTIPMLWFMELSPSAWRLTNAWREVEKLPTANDDPPFILVAVWNGHLAEDPPNVSSTKGDLDTPVIFSDRTATKIPSQFPPECFLALSKRKDGSWGFNVYTLFLLLRDPDGTIFSPLPLLAIELEGDSAKTLEDSFAQSHAVKILDKWIRHLSSPPPNDAPERKVKVKASKIDRERLKFHDLCKARDSELGCKKIADLWNKKESDFCDEGAFRQSIYRARKAQRNESGT